MPEDVLQFLARNGTMLLGGATALLLLGAVMAGAARSPVVRQRVCELSVLGTLVWVVLACVPMRRVEWGNRDARAAVAVAVAPVVAKPAGVTVADIPAELLAKPQGNAVVKPMVAGANRPVANAADVRGWAVMVFLCGAGACCAWLALGHVMLWRLVRRSEEAPGRVGRMIDSRLRPGLRRPRVRVCAGLSRPVTCGAWRPVILLPAALLRDDRAAQLRQVLLHELGHVHQRDGWGSLLFCAALPVLYVHPLYWWLRRGAELSRELVADDWAARADGKEAYVTQLVALARTRAAGSIGPVGAVGILQVRSHFYRRMRMLLQRHRPLATRCSTACRAALGTATLAMVVGMAGVVGVRPASAEPAATGAAPAAERVADVPADHVIGVGDLVSVSDADPNAPAKALRVNKDGNLTIPVYGSIKATGLTGAELARTIARNLRDKNLSPNAPITVRVVEARPTGTGAAAPAATPAPDAAERLGMAARAISGPEQIGNIDPVMHQLQAERQKLDAEIAALRARGLAEGHPEMRSVAARREELDKRIETAAREWRDEQTKRIAYDRISPAGNRGDRAAVVGGVQLDLVNLANTMVDAGGAVRLAKVNYEAHARLAKGGGGSSFDLESAKANLETAVKRLTLLRSIAEVALESAREDLARSKAMYDKGIGDQQSLSAATSKVRMLELIVAGAQ